MKTVGEALGVMADAFVKFADIDPDSLTLIPEAVSNMADGIKEWKDVGAKKLDAKVDSVTNFATAMAAYNDVTISDTLGTNIGALADGLSKCAEVSTGSLDDLCDSLETLMTRIKDLSGTDFATAETQLSNFSTSISGVSISADAFTSLGSDVASNFSKGLTDSVGTVTEAGAEVVQAAADGMDSKTENAVAVAAALVAAIAKVFTDQLQSFVYVGQKLIGSLANGISSKTYDARQAASNVASSSVSAVNEYYENFYNVGRYLVLGFIAGITDYIQKAAQAAAEMAHSAEVAAKEALDENSPSKVFYSIGGFAGQGFVNALTDYGSAAYSAASGMASSAQNGLQNSISKIADIVSGELDTAPTIRPVLDLSAVAAGAGQLNGILGTNPAIGLSGNISAIARTFNEQQYSASNDDIVSAIGSLQKTLGNQTSNVYNVNGITYDDGTNVANAISSLVRAVKIQGRV